MKRLILKIIRMPESLVEGKIRFKKLNKEEFSEFFEDFNNRKDTLTKE